MMNSSEIMSVMELLDIKEVTTKRQRKNGTREFELPIKYYHGGSKIRIASFKSGYVRRQNGCYTPYQINKRTPKEEFFKDYKTTWNDNNTDYTQKWTGKYRKFITRTCKLMMDENERLNYLISYCLKNYYIKNANLVANGEFVTKWEHEYEMKNGSLDRVRELQSENRDLEEKLEQAKDKYKKLNDFYESSKVFNDSMYEGRNDRVKELEKELENRPALDNLSVTVNGERYKII
jgi:hypothetical protein